MFQKSVLFTGANEEISRPVHNLTVSIRFLLQTSLKQLALTFSSWKCWLHVCCIQINFSIIFRYSILVVLTLVVSMVTNCKLFSFSLRKIQVMSLNDDVFGLSSFQCFTRILIHHLLLKKVVSDRDVLYRWMLRADVLNCLKTCKISNTSCSFLLLWESETVSKTRKTMKTYVALIGVLLAILFVKKSASINLVDQPKLFANLTEWNQNLFKRVADCIRDTAITGTETYNLLLLKSYAQPLCNNILRLLNENWTDSNGITTNDANSLRVLINQEYSWTNLAIRIYGSNANRQACGINTAVVPDCIYVTP